MLEGREFAIGDFPAVAPRNARGLAADTHFFRRQPAKLCGCQLIVPAFGIQARLVGAKFTNDSTHPRQDGHGRNRGHVGRSDRRDIAVIAVVMNGRPAREANLGGASPATIMIMIMIMIQSCRENEAVGRQGGRYRGYSDKVTHLRTLM